MPINIPGIQNFYDAAISTDFSRDFQFRIIQMGSIRYDIDLSDRMIFMTTSTLPNRIINNQPVPFMGLSFNVPGSTAYTGSDAWAVTFRMPQDFSLRDTFELWQRDIFDEDSSTGDYKVPRRDSIIHLALLDNYMKVIREYKLYGVYIVNLGDVTYTLTGGGTPVEFTATLAYQYWALAKETPHQPSLNLNPPGGPPVNSPRS
jgi:hypothetical protein